MNSRSALRERASTAYRHAARLFKGFVLRDHVEREAARWFRDRGDETLRLDYPLSWKSVVFDCGGYEGDWAASIRQRYGCSVFVFEPVQAFLDGILKRFDGDPSIHAFGYGLHSRNERTTISLAEAASQAMCPGKACTSSTRCTFSVSAAVPQTPLPNGMRMQAGRPWNGPSTSSRSTLR